MEKDGESVSVRGVGVAFAAPACVNGLLPHPFLCVSSPFQQSRPSLRPFPHLVTDEAEQGSIEEEHAHTVVEEAQDIQGMQALGEDQQHNHPWRAGPAGGGKGPARAWQEIEG